MAAHPVAYATMQAACGVEWDVVLEHLNGGCNLRHMVSNVSMAHGHATSLRSKTLIHGPCYVLQAAGLLKLGTDKLLTPGGLDILSNVDDVTCGACAT